MFEKNKPKAVHQKGTLKKIITGHMKLTIPYNYMNQSVYEKSVMKKNVLRQVENSASETYIKTKTDITGQWTL